MLQALATVAKIISLDIFEAGAKSEPGRALSTFAVAGEGVRPSPPGREFACSPLRPSA